MPYIDLSNYASSDYTDPIEIDKEMRERLRASFQQMANDIVLDMILHSDHLGDDLTYLKGYVNALTDVTVLFDAYEIHKAFKK